MSVDKKIPLVEAFGPTIQGEGAVIGQQTYFLRFGLCDYKCKMCDSMHAVDPYQVKQNAHWFTQEEIFEAMQGIKLPGSTNWVTFSGGNPLIHELSELAQRLKSANWKIAVETQGTLFKTWIHQADIITISPKGPGMGENCDLDILDYFIESLGRSTHKANLKVVAFDQRDLEFAKMMIERYSNYGLPFYLSLGNPYPPGMDAGIEFDSMTNILIGQYRQLFEDIKIDPILSQVRFLPQWHTFVWGNDKGR